jgi:hypothetical protein
MRLEHPALAHNQIIQDHRVELLSPSVVFVSISKTRRLEAHDLGPSDVSDATLEHNYPWPLVQPSWTQR